MVVVHLSSGLGNQLFQYAAGRALALTRGVKLTGDPIAFAPRFQIEKGRTAQRLLALSNLGLPIDLRNVPDHALTGARGYRRVRQLVKDGSRAKFTSRGDYDGKFHVLPGNALLSGYFQDRRYFLDREDFIVEEIGDALAKCALQTDRQQVASSRRPQQVGAVHVRRGDYLGYPEFYPDWFASYYRRVVPYLIERYGLERVDIYSDDVAWCASTFAPLGDGVRVAPRDTRSQGICDLVKMSKYSVLSIANSTFSWWAAAIASIRGATVVAPARWSRWNTEPKTTLYRPTWSVVEVGQG
jgi:hypothetical protein